MTRWGRSGLAVILCLSLGCASIPPDQQAALVRAGVTVGLEAWRQWRSTQVKVEGDGKLDGTGYVPAAGSVVFWVEPGSNKLTGTTRFNPSAGNPFGTGPGGNLRFDVYRARYGEPPTPSSVFPIYAETFGNLLFGAMKEACLSGRLGDSSKFDCLPTFLEASDYASGAQLGPGDPLLRPRTPRPTPTECPPAPPPCPPEKACPTPPPCPSCPVLVIPEDVMAALRKAPGAINIPVRGRNRPAALALQERLRKAVTWAESVNGRPVTPQ